MSRIKKSLTEITANLFAGLKVADKNDAATIVLEDRIAAAIRSALDDLLKNLPQDGADDEPDAAFAAACSEGTKSDTPVRDDLPALCVTSLSVNGMDPVRWRMVGKLPAFIDPRIRKLGRMMFESFPCYRAYADKCKQEGRDPHADVRTISDLTNGATEIQFAARTIVEHGKMLSRGQADFGNLMPGYHPDIGLFLTKSWTFKLVRERVDNGAPVDANYIYAWPGGTDFYQDQRIETKPCLELTCS